MQQLLTGYLKLLLPQTKPNEAVEKDTMKPSTGNPEPNNTNTLLTYPNPTGEWSFLQPVEEKRFINAR